MQCQIYKQETGEIVAWINTEDLHNTIVHKDYGINVGEDLTVIEVDEEQE